MQPTIHTVIFDFGGVLIDWNPRYLYQKLFATESEMEWFLQNVCTDQWNSEQDKGRPFAEAIAFLQNQFPHYSHEIEAFYTRWPEMLAGELSASVQVLYDLQARNYPVYGLTNWSEETFVMAFEHFSFLSTLDGIVVSGTEKMIKPDKAIFKLLQTRYLLTPACCVFIDDKIDNIMVAQELGFQTIHFSSADQLRRELQVLHLL